MHLKVNDYVQVLTGNDREDVVPGNELEVIQSRSVRGIRHRKSQLPSLAFKR